MGCENDGIFAPAKTPVLKTVSINAADFDKMTAAIAAVASVKENNLILIKPGAGGFNCDVQGSISGGKENEEVLARFLVTADNAGITQNYAFAYSLFAVATSGRRAGSDVQIGLNAPSEPLRFTGVGWDWLIIMPCHVGAHR